MATISGGGNARLPTDLSALERADFPDIETMPYVPVSRLTSSDVDSFGRAAQAAWLLDQVTKAFEFSDVNTQLFQLRGLEVTLRSFFEILLEQCSTGQELFCEAIAITIRSVYRYS